jgi:hypothetical protein
MGTDATPVETRAHDVTFVTQCSWAGLRDRLPLVWPTPPDVPPSPKHTYRSGYTYPGWDALEDPEAWEYLSDFELTLYLIDFEPLRPVLAQSLGWTSAKGWTPFDPVSIFLLLGWQITNGWNRAETLRKLRHPRYADLVDNFGFHDDVFPTEGGLRYWLTTLGEHALSDATVQVDMPNADSPREVAIQHLNQLIAQSVTLMVTHGFLNPEAWEQALVCPDGLLHHAASRLRCSAVQASCYHAITPDRPRPCPAQDKQRQGCDCDTRACAEICQYAPSWDADARFVWYTGSNQPSHSPNRSATEDPPSRSSGEGYYGYRSLPLQIPDPQRRFSVILLDDVLPANAREEVPATALLTQLPTFYPSLTVDAVAGDAGFGYPVFLQAIYDDLAARRVVDLRAHTTDNDPTQWPVRGYDDRGRPTCPYGYAFTANGFDAQRQRHKWFCGQACLHDKEPRVRLEDVPYPPVECPYAAPHAQPYGQIINVGARFADGSMRLVRDLPVGSSTWQRLYHRARNAVEGRNAAFEKWNLKRMLVFGLPRSRATIFLADVWLNLTTLARLVREATTATGYT